MQKQGEAPVHEAQPTASGAQAEGTTSGKAAKKNAKRFVFNVPCISTGHWNSLQAAFVTLC